MQPINGAKERKQRLSFGTNGEINTGRRRTKMASEKKRMEMAKRDDRAIDKIKASESRYKELYEYYSQEVVKLQHERAALIKALEQIANTEIGFNTKEDYMRNIARNAINWKYRT